MLSDIYEVRDSQGRRRNTVTRDQAAAGISNGCYRPVGRACVKYLLVNATAGGSITSRDASRTTRLTVGGFEHIQRNCDGFRGVISPVVERHEDWKDSSAVRIVGYDMGSLNAATRRYQAVHKPTYELKNNSRPKRDEED